MKMYFFVLLLLFTSKIFCQTIDQIDSLINVANKLNKSRTFKLKEFDQQKVIPNTITAFHLGDTLLKTIAKFKNKATDRITYYGNYKYGNVFPICVLDIDIKTKKKYLVAYYKGFDTLNYFEERTIEPSEKNRPDFIFRNADFSRLINKQLIKEKYNVKSFEGALVESVALPPHCGNIAWAVVHKFSIYKTSDSAYKNKNILLIETCPEFSKDSFFVKDKNYAFETSPYSGASFDYTLFNFYEDEKLPTFWSSKIKRID